MATLKVGYFGSCLSSLTIAALVKSYGFEEIFRIHHNRSDAFLRYYIDKSCPMPDRALLNSLFVPSDDARVAKDAEEFLDNQMLPHIGYGGTLRGKVDLSRNVFERLEEVKMDVVLLDNFMDIAGKLLSSPLLKGFENSSLFINPHFYKNKDEIGKTFKFGSFLSPDQSAENWLRIYRWFRLSQPSAKIIFLCFPFPIRSYNPDRYGRARDFYPALLRATNGEDIDILPPLNVPEQLTNGPSDQYHVKPQLYQALAGYVYLRTVAKFPSMGAPYKGAADPVLDEAENDTTSVIARPSLSRGDGEVAALVID